MPSLTNLLLVCVIAFAAPFALGLFPRVRLPSVVLEIVAGIIAGPSVLGIVEGDRAIEVVALVGLTFVLFLAGLEIEFRRLRGPVLRLTAVAFAVSFGVAVSLGLSAAGLVDTPLLVAIILSATSLGVLVPVLKDAGEIASTFGQLIIAAASIADFGAIILLTIFFSGEGGTGSTLLLLGSLFALAAVVLVVVRGAERSARIRADLLRLQDTTAQIRVRAALALFVGFAAVAQQLGLEAILGAFVAGAMSNPYSPIGLERPRAPAASAAGCIVRAARNRGQSTPCRRSWQFQTGAAAGLVALLNLRATGESGSAVPTPKSSSMEWASTRPFACDWQCAQRISGSAP
jgi:Kef-type K+ transport system membrane component KefB